MTFTKEEAEIMLDLLQGKANDLEEYSGYLMVSGKREEHRIVEEKLEHVLSAISKISKEGK